MHVITDVCRLTSLTINIIQAGPSLEGGGCVGKLIQQSANKGKGKGREEKGKGEKEREGERRKKRRKGKRRKKGKKEEKGKIGEL